MRVLMTVMVFHPVIGGTERAAKQLATELVRRGHQVDVLTLRRTDCPAEESLDGVRVLRVLRGPGRGLRLIG